MKIRVTQDLQETTKTLQEAAAENSALTETIQELRLQLEVDVLRRERAVRAMFDERVHALERDLAAANTKLQTQAAIASELSELRDEVDLLRPAAAKVAKMEAAVAKYKAKVEELACVQEKLRVRLPCMLRWCSTLLFLTLTLVDVTAVRRIECRAHGEDPVAGSAGVEVRGAAKKARERERGQHSSGASA